MDGATRRYNFLILMDEDGEEDRRVSQKILEYLENNHFHGFYSPRDAHVGMSLFTILKDFIENSDKAFVIVSEEARKNKWWENSAHMLLLDRINNPNLHNTIIPVYLPGVNQNNLPLELQTFEGIYYEEDDGSDFWRKIVMCLQ